MNKKIKVWGELTVLTHWTLSFLLLFLYIDIQNLVLHEFIGGSVTMLLIGRVYFTIKEPATKFESYKTYKISLKMILHYIRELKSHSAKLQLTLNPISRLIIVLILLSLSLTCISGVVLLFSDHFSIFGISSVDLYEHHSDTLSPFYKIVDDIHQLFSNIFIYLIALHILEVLFSSLYFKKNLFLSIINGNKHIDKK